MNIRKIPTLTLAVILAASICGCDNNTESSDSGTSNNNSTITTPDNSYSIPDDATFLRGAMGDPIGLSEITLARDSNFNEISPELLTADNFGEAYINAAYYAFPSYSCRTNLDDNYDADNLLFIGVPQDTISGGYNKVKAGDNIFGLTVSEASSFFNQNARITGGIVGTSLTLDGEITLMGYVQMIPEDEYGVSSGDILFVPLGDVQLPVVRFDGSDENGIPDRRTGDIFAFGDDISFTNDFGGFFRIGNVNNTTADISDIPTDGSFAKVTVTLSDIKMESTLDWITRVTANIVSISAAK